MGLELVFYAVKFLGIAGSFTLYRDIWPFRGIFGVNFKPFVQAWLSVGLNGISGAFWLAYAAVNAFIRVDDQHVLAFIKAIHGANFHAIHIFALDAVFSDDVGHDGPLFNFLTKT
jgi:hypothetical protein